MKFIFIHHSAVSRKDNPDQFEAINNYHKEKWNMISSLGYYGGYNYHISSNGSVRKYRKVGEETIAQVGYNFDGISICLDGNFDVEYPTQNQKDALGNLLVELVEEYGISPNNIKPHRAVANKTCPGMNLPNNWGCNLYFEYKLGKLKSMLMRLLELLGKK
jgi:hypothetical protein